MWRCILNKLFYSKLQSNENIHLAIAKILYSLFSNNNKLLLYFRHQNDLDMDSTFSKSLQTLGLDGCSIVKSLKDSVNPCFVNLGGEKVALQRVAYKNKLDSFTASNLDGILFCPYLSIDDAGIILSKSKIGKLDIVAFSQINDRNLNVLDMFESKEDVNVLPSVT